MSRLQREFERFHRENPHVFDKLVELALFVYDSGKRRYGIAAIFERLRWISEFETVGDPYKLNNNHRAFYARMLHAETPEFAEMFSLRRSVADRDRRTTNAEDGKRL